MNSNTYRLYSSPTYELTEKGKKRLKYLMGVDSWGADIDGEDERDMLQTVGSNCRDCEYKILKWGLDKGLVREGRTIKSVLRDISSKNPSMAYVLDTYVRFAAQDTVSDKEIRDCLSILTRNGYKTYSSSDMGIEALSGSKQGRIAFDSAMQALHFGATTKELGFKPDSTFRGRKEIEKDSLKVLYVLFMDEFIPR